MYFSLRSESKLPAKMFINNNLINYVSSDVSRLRVMDREQENYFTKRLTLETH